MVLATTLVGVPAQAASNLADSKAPNQISNQSEETPKFNIDQAGELGYTAHVENAKATQNQDGTVLITNAQGETVGFLKPQIETVSGTTHKVSYSVSGNQVKATYSDRLVPIVNNGDRGADENFDCAVGATATVAGALVAGGTVVTAAPTFGGSLLVGGAILGSLATAAAGGKACAEAANA
ncbi:hypothetical protein CEPID_01095 [Corynebacterium epidermidicanis]|uniref:Uncharacterized protein n=2 Tax=Corynebacterium epidermidicanis TaxID=1050174 RepID=A0A0G3GLW8_9CORY|nr:hypothetical protein CEPID_01095 [Corynebacterium epidermidicanis]